MPRVHGVDIVRSTTYELIQILNHAYLKARLANLRPDDE